jgi:hypothetical protein
MYRVTELDEFQFVISADRGTGDSVYVLRRAPVWIEVFNGSQRVYLLERCEIEGCGQTPGVCGLTVPVIDNLTSPKNFGVITLEYEIRIGVEVGDLLVFVDLARAR